MTIDEKVKESIEKEDPRYKCFWKEYSENRDKSVTLEYLYGVIKGYNTLCKECRGFNFSCTYYAPEHVYKYRIAKENNL